MWRLRDNYIMSIVITSQDHIHYSLIASFDNERLQRRRSRGKDFPIEAHLVAKTIL
jgi:hypothetical protein